MKAKVIGPFSVVRVDQYESGCGNYRVAFPVQLEDGRVDVCFMSGRKSYADFVGESYRKDLSKVERGDVVEVERERVDAPEGTLLLPKQPKKSVKRRLR